MCLSPYRKRSKVTIVLTIDVYGTTTVKTCLSCFSIRLMKELLSFEENKVIVARDRMCFAKDTSMDDCIVIINARIAGHLLTYDADSFTDETAISVSNVSVCFSSSSVC